MKRGTVLAISVGLVVSAAAGGWLVGRGIESPAEAAARAEPPEPSLITVSVEKTTLSADVIARGDIVFDDPVSVASTGSTGEAGVTPVVTKLPSEGDELVEGSLIIEISGRPVFLLQGVIPSYRDLRPGSEGIDVLQLEEALARLGYLGEPADEVWTAATGTAVRDFYDEAGYRAVGADAGELASLEAARDRVDQARRSVTDAERAVSETTGAAKSEILALRAEVAVAEDAHELALITQTGANDAARRQLTGAAARLDDAEADAQMAADRLAEAESGAHPDTGQPPTPEELEQLRTESETAQAAVVEAEGAVADAEQARVQVEAEQAAFVRQTAAAVEVAEARLAEALTPPDRSSLLDAADAARQELSRAEADLADLEATVGTWLPSGEIVFLERVPVRVDALAVTLGATVSGSFMTVSGSEVTLRVQVQEADAQRLEPGDEAFVDEDDLDAPLRGVIASVATQGSGGRVAVEVTLEEIPPDLIGANVRVVIPIESTAGEVLAVPAAALSAAADGSARVEVEDSPGETRLVEVVPGLAAEGLVEITPVDGELAAGDLVVVGREGSGG